MKTPKPLTLRDEVHGDIVLEGMVRKAVDHPAFQRLRYIKQLGLAEYVFPSATHTRFQHSVGASFLAARYLTSLIDNALRKPFRWDGACEQTRILGTMTDGCLKEVAGDPSSLAFWKEVVGLAGMLHDVGHGPWSHTFENLSLRQDFRKPMQDVPGTVGRYFKRLLSENRVLKHEDISVLYVFKVLQDIAGQDAERFFLPVVSLINRRITMESTFETELEQILQGESLLGGRRMHQLLRPLISGPFDVDRMDYIQRDSRNCGVHIGGIEWRRMIAKLQPCLAEHPNAVGEPENVVLLSELKNQHILDDFVFSLFQMYAQVYMHPKIVGLEDSIRAVLEEKANGFEDFVVTLDEHQSLSDDSFRQMVHRQWKIPLVDALLHRDPKYKFKVASFPSATEPATELKALGFKKLRPEDRPMLKDAAGVFLFHHFSEKPESYFVQPWAKASPVAREFREIYHSPSIWIG